MKAARVTSIEAPQGEEDVDVGEVGEAAAAYLQMVNVNLQECGLPVFRFQVQPLGDQEKWNNGGLDGTGAIMCSYCNKPGHDIANCREKAQQQRGGWVAAVENVYNKVSHESQETLNY